MSKTSLGLLWSSIIHLTAAQRPQWQRGSHRAEEAFAQMTSNYYQAKSAVSVDANGKTEQIAAEVPTERPIPPTVRFHASKPGHQSDKIRTAELSVRTQAKQKSGIRLPLIPYPASVQVKADKTPFVLRRSTVLSYPVESYEEDHRTKLAVKQLLDILQKAGTAEDGDGSNGEIFLSLEVGDRYNKEGYKLEITSDKVQLSANEPAGLLYGVQTLRQLASDSMQVPVSVIEDAPRFGWRGLHLDVSRHFFPADNVKKLLDTMVAFKLNSFHWHLTDDQGWRIPIKGYPALTEIGAQNLNGVNESYTLDEIKDVIEYAAARNIQVLPEIDVPGHASAAISAYPFLGNTDIPGWSPPSRPPTTYGVHPHTISPKQTSFEFLTKVFETVAETFPSEFVHIGGDEVLQDEWEQSPRAMSFIRQDVGREVQAVFHEKIGAILKNEGRTAVGWDQINHVGGLPGDAVVMAWRSSDELVEAVQTGKRAVQADQASYYFDHYQSQSESDENKASQHYLPLHKVYNNDPLPAGLSKEERSLVLGGQGQLWSEYMTTWDHVEYMAHPRSIALAERLWSPNREIESFNEFKGRLQVRLKDLEAMNVNYCKLQ